MADGVERHFRSAVRLWREGSAARAFGELARASRALPMSARLAASLVRFSRLAGTEAAAITLLEASLATSTTDVQHAVRRQLARVLRRVEQFPRAIATLEPLLVESPEDRRARRVLQVLRGRVGMKRADTPAASASVLARLPTLKSGVHASAVWDEDVDVRAETVVDATGALAPPPVTPAPPRSFTMELPWAQLRVDGPPLGLTTVSPPRAPDAGVSENAASHATQVADATPTAAESRTVLPPEEAASATAASGTEGLSSKVEGERAAGGPVSPGPMVPWGDGAESDSGASSGAKSSGEPLSSAPPLSLAEAGAGVASPESGVGVVSQRLVEAGASSSSPAQGVSEAGEKTAAPESQPGLSQRRVSEMRGARERHAPDERGSREGPSPEVPGAQERPSPEARESREGPSPEVPGAQERSSPEERGAREGPSPEKHGAREGPGTSEDSQRGAREGRGAPEDPRRGAREGHGAPQDSRAKTVVEMPLVAIPEGPAPAARTVVEMPAVRVVGQGNEDLSVPWPEQRAEPPGQEPMAGRAAAPVRGEGPGRDIPVLDPVAPPRTTESRGERSDTREVAIPARDDGASPRSETTEVPLADLFAALGGVPGASVEPARKVSSGVEPGLSGGVPVASPEGVATSGGSRPVADAKASAREDAEELARSQKLEAQLVARRAWKELAQLYLKRADRARDAAARADALTRLAEVMENELNDPAGAARMYREIVELTGDRAALREQVRLLSSRDDMSLVRRALDEAIQRAKTGRARATALLTRGERWLHMGELAKARADFEAADALVPGMLAVLAGLLLCVGDTERPSVALRLRAALAQTPRRASDRLEALRVLARTSEEPLKDARLAQWAWSEVLVESPESEQARSRLLALARELGDTQALGQLLRAQITQEPRGPVARQARLELVATLEAHGDAEGALTELRQAVRYEPGHKEAWLLLVERLQARGNKGEAAWALEHAATATEDELEREQTWDRLARMWRESLGNPERAQVYARRAEGIRLARAEREIPPPPEPPRSATPRREPSGPRSPLVSPPPEPPRSATPRREPSGPRSPLVAPPVATTSLVRAGSNDLSEEVTSSTDEAGAPAGGRESRTAADAVFQDERTVVRPEDGNAGPTPRKPRPDAQPSNARQERQGVVAEATAHPPRGDAPGAQAGASARGVSPGVQSPQRGGRPEVTTGDAGARGTRGEKPGASAPAMGASSPTRGERAEAPDDAAQAQAPRGRRSDAPDDAARAQAPRGRADASSEAAQPPRGERAGAPPEGVGAKGNRGEKSPGPSASPPAEKPLPASGPRGAKPAASPDAPPATSRPDARQSLDKSVASGSTVVFGADIPVLHPEKPDARVAKAPAPAARPPPGASGGRGKGMDLMSGTELDLDAAPVPETRVISWEAPPGRMDPVRRVIRSRPEGTAAGPAPGRSMFSKPAAPTVGSTETRESPVVPEPAPPADTEPDAFRQLRERPLDTVAYTQLAAFFDTRGDAPRAALMREIVDALEGRAAPEPRLHRSPLSIEERAGLRHPGLRTTSGELLACAGIALCRLFPAQGRAADASEPLRASSGPGAPAVLDALHSSARVLSMNLPELILSEDDAPPFSAVHAGSPRLLVGRAVVRQELSAAELRFHAGRALLSLSPDLLALRALKGAQLLRALALLATVLKDPKDPSADARLVRESLSPRALERTRELLEPGTRDFNASALADAARDSANRAGLVACGGVGSAVTVIRSRRFQESELVELLRFAASERYLALRAVR
ncbi:hypothetical protein LY474_16860 [Myxococcus stipitatus]|nr:hypothetical protein [Myxococcus stipitatus]MCE9669483.1 hypothetical protein [Myxococcus stipitatus]